MTQPFPPNYSHSVSPPPPIPPPHEREGAPPIPKIVYKYLDSIGGRLALHEHTIKYTSIRHFNDPFECMFGFFSPADVERFLAEAEAARSNRCKWDVFCNIYRDIIPYKPIERENLRCKPNGELLRLLDKRYDGAQKRLLPGFGKTIGVASFSDRKDSILMWSHYAQQHKGIVIGYDTACFRSILPDGAGAALYPVEYVDTRIEIPLSSDVPWGTLDRLATTKYRDWSYEHEWRSVFLDTDENMGDLISIFRKIEPRFIREINIGACTEFETRKECCIYCADHPECDFFEAHFHRQEFALEFKHRPVEWE